MHFEDVPKSTLLIATCHRAHLEDVLRRALGNGEQYRFHAAIEGSGWSGRVITVKPIKGLIPFLPPLDGRAMARELLNLTPEARYPQPPKREQVNKGWEIRSGWYAGAPVIVAYAAWA